MWSYVAKIGLPLAGGFLWAETIVGAVNWSATITLGSIILGIIVGLAGLATFGYGVRWKTAYETERATAESLRDGREAFELRGDRLAMELREARQQIQEMTDDLITAKAEVAQLQERPDLGQILQIIGEQSIRADAAAELRVNAAIERITEMFTELIKRHDQGVRQRQEEILLELRRLR